MIEFLNRREGALAAEVAVEISAELAAEEVWRAKWLQYLAAVAFGAWVLLVFALVVISRFQEARQDSRFSN